MKKYNHAQIEKKWREKWEQDKLYKTPADATRDNKYYVLPQLPYPSGAGLHVGHAEIYNACDIYARYMRMTGKSVLQVIGWDAFGLPAENYAIKTNIHPRVNTNQAINNFRKQIKMLGISVDWEREVGSHNPDYYKWTQWFFLLMYERGLAYRKKQQVNWCNFDKTVLANEQVEEGKCERCGNEVVQREMEQWFLKITDYADRLATDLDKVDWPEETVKRQRDWIGKSEGAEVTFKLHGAEAEIKVFTTRPDTIFGATFIVIAPEHHLLEKLQPYIKNWTEVEAYQRQAAKKNELERQQEKAKTGLRLEGISALNPANEEEIPVFIADYVLSTYGTGAIMAVPGHDERDFEFARKFNLPVVRVVLPQNINRSLILKQSVSDSFDRVLKDNGYNVSFSARGHYQVEFEDVQVEDYIKLIRKNISSNFFVDVIGSNNLVIFPDMVISVDTKEGEQKAVREIASRFPRLAKSHDLQSLMVFQFGDEMEESHFYREILVYTGEGFLVNSGQFNKTLNTEAKVAITEWLNALGAAEKKTTFRLRDWSVSRQRFWGSPIPIVYDPEGNPHPVDQEDLPVILPDDVDFKPTGQSPLTYSDEFHKGVEKKYGKGWKREVDTLDTFMCSSWYFFRYIDPHNDKEFASKKALETWMPVDFYLGGTEHVNGHLLYARFFTKVLFDAGYINFDEPFLVHRHQGTIFGPDGRRMSKRWGNIINPTDVVKKYGADTTRMYEMFMGPLEQDKAWSDKATQGVRRFLQRVYEFNSNYLKKKTDGEMSPVMHKLIKKVTENLPRLRFNVVIAEFMKALNLFESAPEKVNYSDWKNFLILMAPFAPFLMEELWEQLGETYSIHSQDWPKFDPKKILLEKVVVAVQVNGKVRDKISVETGLNEADITELAKKSSRVEKYLSGKQIKKTVYIQDKIISFVV